MKELLAAGVSEPTEALATSATAAAPSTAAATSKEEQGAGIKAEEPSIPEGKAGEAGAPSLAKEVPFDGEQKGGGQEAVERLALLRLLAC